MNSSPRLLGRDDELGRLKAALDEAQRGNGAVVLLEGEAGIGKTRLLDEISAIATAAGVDVRRGSAEELEQGRPFGALIDALGPVVSPVQTGAEANAEEARYLAQDEYVALVDSLAGREPFLLTLDDLHWADRATLSTAWALARSAATSRLVLVLAFRPSPRPTELDRVIDGCVRLGAAHVTVAPLGDDALAGLAAEIVGASPGPGLVEQLRGARGNPFVGIELLHALEDDNALEVVDDRADVRVRGLPPALRGSLLRRLTSMPNDVREVLRVAAVLGNAGRVENLAALLERPVADITPLVRDAVQAGLLEEAGDRLVFRHDLIREALYEDLPEAARVALHASAARALHDTADPAVVARHVALGAMPGDADAIAALRRLGTDLVANRPDAAADSLSRALELEDTKVRRADIGAELAHALLAAGRAADADAAFVAAPIAEASPATMASLQIAHAEACSHQGRVQDAVDGFTAALEVGSLDPADAARARGRQAENRLWTFSLEEAQTESERAIDEGRRLDLLEVVTEGLATRSAVHQFRAEFDQAVAVGREAVATAGSDPQALRRTPHAYLGLALLAADELDEARAVGEEGRRLSTELGQILVLPNYYALLTRIAWFSGRWDDVLMEADAAAALADDFGLGFGSTANEAVRGLVAFHRGDHAAAKQVLEQRQVAARGDNEDSAGSELLVLLQARVLESEGDGAGAAKLLRSMFDTERALGMDTARLWPGPDCVRFALEAGLDDVAEEIADDLASVAARAGTTSARGYAALARAFVDADPDAMLDAADDFGASHRPFDAVRARESAGVAFVSADRRDAAVKALTHALEGADELGAVHDGRRIAAQLRELGVRLPGRSAGTRPQSGWESLTAAELEVSKLVAEGLTNPEVGERLFVSRRTVSTHLSHIFTKLDLRSRVELAAEVLKHTG